MNLIKILILTILAGLALIVKANISDIDPLQKFMVINNVGSYYHDN